MAEKNHHEQSISGLLEQIEKTPYFWSMTVAADRFKKAVELAEQQGELTIARHARFEFEINYLSVSHRFLGNDSKQRFRWPFRSSDCSEGPDLDSFSPEQFDYYESRLHETRNPFLKCRYADVLFDCDYRGLNSNKFELGSLLVDLLIETGLTHLCQPQHDYLLYLRNMARAADVSTKLSNFTMLGSVVDSLVSVMREMANKNLRYLKEASKIMRGIYSGPLGSQLPSDTYEKVVRRLDEARAYFLGSEDLLGLHRSLCEELLAWSRFLEWVENRKKSLQMEIGASYEREAELQLLKYGSNMLKAKSLEEALGHYVNIGATDKIPDLKVRIRKARAASKDEYRPVSSTFKIPMEEIEKRVSPYRQLSIADGLRLMASDPNLVVDIASIEHQVSETKQSHGFAFALFPHVIDNDRKVFQSDSADETFRFFVDAEYGIRLKVTAEILLREIFEFLTRENGMIPKDMINFLTNWPLLDEENALIVSVGIGRFFAGDYVSALHILVPQFESCLRRMFAQAGFSTTSIRSGETQHEETLTSFLEREDVKATLKPNFHKYIQYVMVDQQGLNLRNEVAHGLIKPSDCSENNVQVLIHMFLILTHYRIDPGEED